MKRSPLRSLLSACLLAAGLAACSSSPGQTGGPSVSSGEAQMIQSLMAHRQGLLSADPNPLHWAIDGVGYFSVMDPKSGERWFTRNGAFELDPNGQIQTREGYLLDRAITLHPTTERVYIAEDGTVMSKLPGEQYKELGRVIIYRFPKPDKLAPHPSIPDLYKSTPASGAHEQGQPTQNYFGLVLGGAREDLASLPAAIPDAGCRQPAKTLRETGRVQDLAIEGKGFLMLLHPGTREPLFTRRGQIKILQGGEYPVFMPTGTLTTPHGYPLQAQLLPPGRQLTGADNFPRLSLGANQSLQRIDPRGIVWARTGIADSEVGRLRLAVFDNLTLLEPFSFGRQTVYRIRRDKLNGNPSGKGLYQEVYPGDNGAATIKSGAYEDCGSDLLAAPAAPVR